MTIKSSTPTHLSGGAGSTASRPTGLGPTDIGYQYFDTSVGAPVWWNGSAWVVASTGASTAAPVVSAIAGNGTQADFTVTHNLNTLSPEVTVVDNDALNSGANRQILVTPTPSTITANAYHLVFASAPAAGETFTVVTRTGSASSGGGGGGGSGSTNLSSGASATTVTVISDTGTDATLTAATASTAGVMTAADRLKLDGITGTNTGNQTAATVPVTPAGGLPGPNVQAALEKLQGDVDTLAAGAGITNLAATATGTTVTVTSDTGADATLAAATTTAAGVMSAADKTKLGQLVGVRAWAPSTPYAINDVVLQGSTLYRATTAHTSSALFATDSANWSTLTGGGGGGTTGVFSVDSQGRLVLDNGAGTTTRVGLNLEQKTVFGSQSFTTAVGDSAVDVFRTAWQITHYQVIVQTAPSSGPETYALQDVTANTTIFSATLNSGQTTTGVVALSPAYTLAAGNQFRARILTINGSEGLVIHVWRTPVLHGMELA